MAIASSLVIYDVAVSIDGYISGPDGDISSFAHSGPVVDDYLSRLEHYSVAIMGRKTYEFGYRFGLEVGKNPYPTMHTIVFSRSLTLPHDSEVTVSSVLDKGIIERIRDQVDAPIYLCGGGDFAGALLSMGLIDRLRLKRAPTVLSDGVRLFGSCPVPTALQCLDTRQYDGGYLLQELEVLR